MKIFPIRTSLFFLTLIFSLPSLSAIKVGEYQFLEKRMPLVEKNDSDLIVDALWPKQSNKIYVSKQGNQSEIYIFEVDLDDEMLILEKRQSFNGAAPLFLENRDGVFLFKPHQSPSEENAALYILDSHQEFMPFYIFDDQTKNIAASMQSNFIITIDNVKAKDMDVEVAPRLKLYNTITKPKKGQKTLQRQGNAIGFTDVKNNTGNVVALAMSPMKRQDDLAANRLIALVHAIDNKNVLHLWYFPNIKSDFNNYQGHMALSFPYSVETIVLSPNTFGSMLFTNKTLGKISVLKFNFTTKKITQIDNLEIEKPLNENSTNIATVFGPNDEILAGINHSLFLYKKDNLGAYKQEDVQPVKNFDLDENFSKILLKGNSFIAIGTKGHVQFGNID